MFFGKQLRYLELFPDQHWSMSSYDPKERRKLATHAEGVPRFRQSDFELPSCLVLGMILGHLGWKHFPCKKARLDYTIFFANSFFSASFPKWHQPHQTIGIKRYFARIWFAFSLPAHIALRIWIWTSRTWNIHLWTSLRHRAWSAKNAGPRRSLVARSNPSRQVRQRCDEEVSIERLYVSWVKVGLKVGRWGGGVQWNWHPIQVTMYWR